MSFFNNKYFQKVYLSLNYSNVCNFVLFKFDKEIQQRWNAAVDAGCFAYKLDHVEGRVVPGKYQIFIQVQYDCRWWGNGEGIEEQGKRRGDIYI